MQMFKYYEIVANCNTVLYGSYDRSEATYELEAERDSWKDEGYRGIKLRWSATEEKPDTSIYGKSFKPATTKVLAKWQSDKVANNIHQALLNMPDFTNKALAKFVASL